MEFLRFHLDRLIGPSDEGHPVHVDDDGVIRFTEYSDPANLSVIIRLDPKLRDVHSRHRFHPDGLPYPALRRIPDPAGSHGLLAPGILLAVKQIPHLHQKVVLPLCQLIGDIKGKSGISASVASDVFPLTNTVAR